MCWWVGGEGVGEKETAGKTHGVKQFHNRVSNLFFNFVYFIDIYGAGLQLNSLLPNVCFRQLSLRHVRNKFRLLDFQKKREGSVEHHSSTVYLNTNSQLSSDL
jgi:hypothetical protein